MTDNAKGPTLTDTVGMGGVIAQEGFDNQLWELLVRLPKWLSNPAFEAVILEGLEDIEARFFAPHAPEQHLLERVQVKSGSLSAQAIRAVFQRFLDFEESHPRITRVHTLVISQLPATLKWVARDTGRVRRARPFYAPFAGVSAANDAQLASDFGETFGGRLGTFIASDVEVLERSLPSRESAIPAFIAALNGAFPSVDPSAREVRAIFSALEGLVRRSVGMTLARRTLIETVEQEMSVTLAFKQNFPIHLRSDRNGADESSLEIDASIFSGGPAGFPERARWQTELVMPLEATALWLKQQGIVRVALSGSFRLTTAIVLGRSFRSANGFELEILTKGGKWATDDRPADQLQDDWSIKLPRTLESDALIVSVGVLRRPADDLRAMGLAADQLLDAFSASPIVSAKAAQAGVFRVKAAVVEAAVRLQAKRVLLYYAGPAGFAVALGHRWNAMPPTDLFEWDSMKRKYVPTAYFS